MAADTLSRRVDAPVATDYVAFERSEGNRVFPLRIAVGDMLERLDITLTTGSIHATKTPLSRRRRVARSRS